MILIFKKDEKLPLYRVVAEAVKQAIVEQNLAVGDSLPSARDLANQYQLSLSTVLRAYEELASQGYVVTSPSSRTHVASQINEQLEISNENPPVASSSVPLREPKLSLYGQRLANAQSLSSSDIAIPGAEVMPTAVWLRLLTKYRSNYDFAKALSEYSADPFGHVPLRRAIIKYLKRVRGISCTLDQLVVTTALRSDLIFRLLIDAGDNVAVENPCSPAVRAVLLSHGAKLVPVNSDSKGLNPEQMFASETEFKMLYLCPSHQEPSGAVLPIDRRLAVLEWSQRTGTIIFEDDFDCNYHYTGSPLPALQSLKENDTVIYSGSFWLTLGPLVSIGFFVLPRRYIPVMQTLISTVHPEPPIPENYALAEFIADGHLERHIHKQRALNLKRRQALIFELSVALGKLAVLKESSGMHVLVQFNQSLQQSFIVDCARQSGLDLRSTESYYFNQPPTNEFLMPFSTSDADTISAVVKRFSVLLVSSL
ncbi:MAG: PLP-dependent aminotransferase family protein [Candidatus Obscuribacterales bacterium]|nr:PLP-dependent aminotransferase family protein [Candidatus Obscuribacterales bacterium]